MADDLTCSGCCHWKDKGINPQDLAAGRIGECRERVHMLMISGPGPNRQWVCQPSAGYPELPASFPACSHFQARLELKLT